LLAFFRFLVLSFIRGSFRVIAPVDHSTGEPFNFQLNSVYPQGLMPLEVEMTQEQEKNLSFPEWLKGGGDVTHRRDLKNWALALNGIPQAIEKMIDEHKKTANLTLARWGEKTHPKWNKLLKTVLMISGVTPEHELAHRLSVKGSYAKFWEIMFEGHVQGIRGAPRYVAPVVNVAVAVILFALPFIFTLGLFLKITILILAALRVIAFLFEFSLGGDFVAMEEFDIRENENVIKKRNNSYLKAQSSVKVIAITGPIACGKSTALRYLAERGYYTLDVDEVLSRNVCEDIREQLVKVFGKEVINEQNGIARKVVIKHRKLEQEFFRIIRRFFLRKIHEKIVQAASEGVNTVFFESANLNKFWFNDCFDDIWYIAIADTEERKERLISRELVRPGMTRDYMIGMFDMLNNKQLSHEEYLKMSTKMIKNNGTLNGFYAKIDTILRGSNLNRSATPLVSDSET
jgi:dephospho-CoA kinase